MSRIDIDILTEDAKAALLELARLLGRIAAEDAVDQSTLDTSPPHSLLHDLSQFVAAGTNTCSSVTLSPLLLISDHLIFLRRFTVC